MSQDSNPSAIDADERLTLADEYAAFDVRGWPEISDAELSGIVGMGQEADEENDEAWALVHGYEDPDYLEEDPLSEVLSRLVAHEISAPKALEVMDRLLPRGELSEFQRKSLMKALDATRLDDLGLSDPERIALLLLRQSLSYLTDRLTAEELATVKRIRPGMITAEEADRTLRYLDNALAHDRQTEIVAEIRADEVSGEAVAAMGAGMLGWNEVMSQPPQVPLIDGVITQGSVGSVIGAQGLGKSFLVLAWALCVSTGTPWLGRPVKQAKVLYVVGEGAAGLPKRMAAWSEQNQAQPDQDAFLVLPTPGRLDNPRTMRAVSRAAADAGVGFVILDTLSALAPEAEQPANAPLFLASLTAMREEISTECAGPGTVMFVHHPGWGDPTRSRNSVTLEANVDEVRVLTAADDRSPVLTLLGKKMKDGVDGWTISLARQKLGDSCVITGLNASGAVSTVGAAEVAQHPVTLAEISWEDRVRGHLAAKGSEGVTVAEIATGLEVSRDHRKLVYKALNGLRAGGQAVSDNKKRGVTRLVEFPRLCSAKFPTCGRWSL